MPMLVNHSKLIGSSVIELKTQTNVGRVSDFVISKHELKISGIILDRTIFSTVNAISASDIIEIAPNIVIVHDQKAVAPLKEAIRMNDAYREGFHGLYQKVVTKSGKTIGIVFDYLVDSSTLAIVKFYVRALVREKIIAAQSVIELRGKKLIIKDDFEKIASRSSVVELNVAKS